MSINIYNKYNSSDLLFSIPVHEKQDIINNHIENILNYNPNSNIILHINKSFHSFQNNLTNYKNVTINSVSLNYEYAKGLFLIHIKNFLEAIRLNISFKYFVILSSNEMFIKYGLIDYINQYKNGVQIVAFDKNIEWHNFHKKLEVDPKIINMLKGLDLDTFYGGQTEGQFYQVSIFKRMADIYLTYFGENELNDFETEEIIPQTIFKSFYISYGKPITLQNYSNRIHYDYHFIDNLIINSSTDFQIKEDKMKHALSSPHVDSHLDSVFSIKRVDRTFNNIRNFLSKKGFIMNKDIFLLNTYYYSNNSSLIVYENNYFKFSKRGESSKKDFHWFAYELDEAFYLLSFKMKRINVNPNGKFGIKIEKPYEIFYNLCEYEFEKSNDEWSEVKIPLHITLKQNVLFIFDEYLYELDFYIKDIVFDKEFHSEKENIALLLYENINENAHNNYNINYNNIRKFIIKPLENIYNIFIFTSLYNSNKINNVINCYKPCSTFVINNKNINEQFILNIDNIHYFSNKVNIHFNFLLAFSLDSLFKKSIIDFNFYIKKINFISYHIPYYNNKISNSYQFLSIPYEYISYFYDLLKKNIHDSNICYSLYYYLSHYIDKNNFNFILDDNYSKDMRTPLIKYLSDINTVDNQKGYLFNNKYYYNVYYYNDYSKIIKLEKNEFYFYKKRMVKPESFQWIGLHLNDIEHLNIGNNVKIKFDIKFMKSFQKSDALYGLKIHNPLFYLNDWLHNDFELECYYPIEINVRIDKKSQYILLNFDNYLDEIEFYIKDYKIILNYL